MPRRKPHKKIQNSFTFNKRKNLIAVMVKKSQKPSKNEIINRP